MVLKFHYLPLNFNFLKHVFHQINLGKTPIRIFHNYFLKGVNISGKTIDIGSGKHSSYFKFMQSNKTQIFYADKFQSKEENFIKVDLEQKMPIEDQTFDTVLLFNVLEHVKNYNNLLKEINRILKPGGKFEIFVPFMHRYHEDPEDYLRPTHTYLFEILKNNNFKVSTNVIGVGPFTVISEILIKYFKFKIFKFPILIIFLILDKIMKLFSKDFNTFYLGVHCSCTKQ